MVRKVYFNQIVWQKTMILSEWTDRLTQTRCLSDIEEYCEVFIPETHFLCVQVQLVSF